MTGAPEPLLTHEGLAHAFAMTTETGVGALRLDGYGLAVGCYADLVLILAASIPEAVLDRPLGRIVIRRGRIVAGVTAVAS